MKERIHKTFIFESYTFDYATWTASFVYSFDGQRYFTERVQFESTEKPVQKDVLERVLELAFFVVGTSYYKCFPVKRVEYKGKKFSPKQAAFLNKVYRDGLSQFIFQNQLSPDDLFQVDAHGKDPEPLVYSGDGVLSLQSGGKDSLLMGEFLNEKQLPYTTFYVTTTRTYPKIIERLNKKEPHIARRFIDKVALDKAAQDGGLNGHVPVTYIVMSFALIEAVLHGENVVLSAVGKEGNEPHAMVGDLPVNHQWSKTWEAEQLFSDYVTTCVSPSLKAGSPLRPFSELKIAEMFEEKCWAPYSYGFSSCNVENYEQGHLNTELRWCGKCPKCANTFLLFSPFVIPYELRRIFDSQDLFSSQNLDLQKAFKGILGVGNSMKPFECVGEIDELRTAYQMAQVRYGTQACQLPFAVPEGHFDYRALGPRQEWSDDYVPDRFLQNA